MRVILTTIYCDIVRPDTLEVVSVELSSSLRVRRAFNEYGMSVELTPAEQSKIKRKLRARIINASQDD